MRKDFRSYNLGALVSLTGTIAALIILSVGRCSFAQINQGIGDGTFVEFREGIEISQTFLSHYPGLSEISVKALEISDNYDVPISLQINDVQSSTSSIFSQKYQVDDISEGNWLRFSFQPIDDSESKFLSFVMSTESASSLKLSTHSDNLYPEGYSSHNGDLVFKISFRGKCFPTIAVLMQRMAIGKPGLLGLPGFYYFLSITFFTILLFWISATIQRIIRT